MQHNRSLILHSILAASLAASLAACGGGGGAETPVTLPAQITLALEFESAPDRVVDVRMLITASSGYVPDLSMLSVTSDFGTVGMVSQQSTAANEFEFSALLIPDSIDNTGDIWTGEIAITARYLDGSEQIDTSITRSALVLSDKLAGIGQPEVVPGLVNTRGVEDSPEISSDGQWLTVGTYMPIDFGYCLVKGSGFNEPACNLNFYDTTGVERPGLFGVERIIDSQTIDHAIPSLGYDPLVGGLATPPTSSYLFRRLPDGSYGDPKVLGVDTGGYTWQAPYGYTIDSISGAQARVFFAFNDLSDSPDTSTDVYFADIVLGSENVLGVFENGGMQGFTAVKVEIDPLGVCGTSACEDSNPHITDDRLWFDNERDTDDLFFVDVTRDAAGIPTAFSAPMRVPVSQTLRGESMPHMDGDTLYYQCNTSLCRSALASPGADPALTGSWLPEEEVLVGASMVPFTINGGRNGRIVATTEPSIATVVVRDETQKWLYFGYLLQTHYGAAADEFGANWNVGRVRLSP